MPDTLTRRDLNRALLARQLLLERERVGVREAVERLAGIQAQDARPPYIGLWSRIDGFARDDLHGAYHDGTVVRATLMRGTLHTVSARDYAAIRRPLAPLLAAAGRGFEKEVADLDAVLGAARELLAEGPRTMPELRELLGERFPREAPRPMAYLVRLHVPLVVVPTDDRWSFGRDTTFALAEDLVDERSGPEALIRRYLGALGPASAKDVEVWGGPPKPQAEALLQTMDVAAFADERGRTLYDLPDAPRPGGDAPAPIRLVGDFDNMVLSHEDRTRIVADEHRKLLIPTKNLRVKATFLLDGFVAGIWSAQRKGKKATLTLAPFARLKKADAKALTAEADALLRFMEPDATSFDVVVDG